MDPVNATRGEGSAQGARIWYQSFVDPVAQEPYIRRLQQRLDDYAAPGVRYAVHGMSPPDRYLSPLTEFRCAGRAIRSALQAEAEGYDAFVLVGPGSRRFNSPGDLERAGLVYSPIAPATAA